MIFLSIIVIQKVNLHTRWHKLTHFPLSGNAQVGGGLDGEYRYEVERGAVQCDIPVACEAGRLLRVVGGTMPAIVWYPTHLGKPAGTPSMLRRHFGFLGDILNQNSCNLMEISLLM